MDDKDPELERLFRAECVAFERFQRVRVSWLRADVQKAAEELWKEAVQAVEDYRAKHS
jgi:hypothetical protein